MSEWQPIDTAPENTDVLVWEAYGEQFVVAQQEDGCWVAVWSGEPIGDVTHWMPLPEPPSA